MVNINQLMKQAQAMQSKMQEMQAQMESAEFEGKAGGNMVAIKISGKHEVKSVKIDPSIIDPTEKEMLEDLIAAAFNDAKSTVENASKDSMSNALVGMSLPTGFKMPF